MFNYNGQIAAGQEENKEKKETCEKKDCKPCQSKALKFADFCEQNKNLVDQKVFDTALQSLKEGIEENYNVTDVEINLIIDGKSHYIGNTRTNSGKGLWYCGSWEQSKVKGHECHKIISLTYGQGRYADRYTIPITFQNQAVFDLYLSQKGNADTVNAAKVALAKQAENRKAEDQRRLESEKVRQARICSKIAYYNRIYDTLPSTCQGPQASYFAAKGLSDVEVMPLPNIRYLHNCKYGSFALDRDNIPNLPSGTVILARGTKLDGTNFYQELWPNHAIIKGERVNKNIIGSKKDGWIEINKLPPNLKRIVICEGVATALSIYFFIAYNAEYANDTWIIAAIDCDNLKHVANALKSLLAKKGIYNVPTLFCADDDLHNLRNDRIRKNTGVDGAKEASSLLPISLVITPDFKSAGIEREREDTTTVKAKYKDFNDLFILPNGLKIIARQVKQALDVLHAKVNIAAKVKSKQMRETKLNPTKAKHNRLNALISQYQAIFANVKQVQYIGDKLPSEFSQLCYDNAMQIANGQKRKTTIVVLSPMASGKTFQAAKLFDLLRQDIRTNAIYISCLQSLCRDASNRGLGKNYQEIKQARRQTQNTQDAPKYSSWCIPSLAEFASNFNFFSSLDAAIIDETELIANFLKSKFDNKKSALQILDKILALANIAVMCDAYSSTKTLELVKQYRNDTDIIIVSLSQPTPKDKQVMLYPSKPAILLGCERKLEQGEHIYLTINNKKLAKDVAKTLEQKFGDKKKILLIHAENSGGKNAANQDQKAFLDNPNNEIVKYDIVITSPVIGSGFSIDVSYIDSVFGIFCNTPNTSDTSSCLQQLARVRNPISTLYHVCLVGKELDLETDINAIQAMYYKAYRYDKALWQLIQGAKKGYPVYTITDAKYESVLWCVLSDFATNKNNFYSNLLNCFALDNFNKYYTFSPTPEDAKTQENLEKDASERLKDASEKVKTEHIASVQNAAKLTSYEYQTLSTKATKTQAENDQIEKYDILKFYRLENASQDEQNEVIKFDLENDGRRKLHNWKVITSPSLEAFENLYKNASNVRTEHKANLWKARLLLGANGLLPILGINAKLELDTTVTYTRHNKDILAYLQTLLDNYNAACKTLKLPSKVRLLNQIATNPLKAVGTILNLLGLKQGVQHTRKNNYKLDSQAFAVWKNWLVKLGYWQDGYTAYIYTLPSKSKPTANIATTFDAIQALLTSKGQNGHALIAQLHNKVITVDMFLHIAINCYATNAKNGRFYQSLATKISSLINLFPLDNWQKYLG